MSLSDTSHLPPDVSAPKLLRDESSYRPSKLAVWSQYFPILNSLYGVRTATGLLSYTRIDRTRWLPVTGYQCVELRTQLPHLPNRVIVQDAPKTLGQALQHPGVEAIAQDLFQPQAYKGAKIYYLRNVIHDHGDDRSALILKHSRDAMGPDSVILIADMIFPDVGAHWHATSLDLTTMCATAARERTREQWGALANKAGLRISNIYPYTTVLQNSVIECVPK